MKSLFKPFRQPHRNDKTSSASPAHSETMYPLPPPHPESSPRRLAVVELFQSQGCNSCPPANSNVIDLACSAAPARRSTAPLPTDPGVDYLLLTYHVTYWDHLGWKDTYGDRTSDDRQRDYVRRMGLRGAFTPQVVVNGRSSGVGSSKSDLARLLRQGDAGGAASLPVQISVAADDDREDLVVSVDATQVVDSGRTLDVWLVRYDPARRNVAIRSGENAGSTLPHFNVVRSLRRVGEVRAGEERASVVVNQKKDGLAGAVLVQDGPGGRILGAAKLQNSPTRL